MEVTETDTRYDTSAVTGGQSTSSWTTTVAVNGHELVFKLDTGADVTIISDDTFKSLNIEDQELQSSYKRLGSQTASP